MAIPRTPQVAGVLGVEYAPFSTQTTPRAGQPFTVRGLALDRGLTPEMMERRQQLRTDLEAAFRAHDRDSGLRRGLDRFAQRAHDILSSPRCRQAFDISREPASITRLFPDSSLAQSCLLAVRLVEAGVRFVSVDHGGWDTHDHNFPTLKECSVLAGNRNVSGGSGAIRLSKDSRLRALHNLVAANSGLLEGRQHWPRRPSPTLFQPQRWPRP